MSEDNEPKFKIGDIVVLKSGGPTMTVWGANEMLGSIHYSVTWFVGGENKQGVFNEPELVAHPTYKEFREATAIALALGNNGGVWAKHHTSEQQEHWRKLAGRIIDAAHTEILCQLSKSS